MHYHYLHNDVEKFKKVVKETSEHFNISKDYIIHDYWCSFILKAISENIPNIVFKGGTSLSKCFGAIDRYSEDLDLNLIQEVSPTQSIRRDFHHKLIETIDNLGLEILNKESFRSTGRINSILIKIGENDFSETVRVETYLVLKSFPIVKKYAHSYIEKYLNETKQISLLNEYDLNAFEISTQSFERTFIDKIFAICDYFEANKSERNSRHLYDLHKLKDSICFNEEFKNLFEEVKTERRNAAKEITISAQPGYKLMETLEKILDKDFYKRDYLRQTQHVLFDETKYEDVKQSVHSIIKNMKTLNIQ